MLTSALRAASSLSYRLGLGAQPSAMPDHRLVELVEGPGKLTPGRALDLGCGTGRNAIYLATHGWDTVGVDMVGYALDVARRSAAERGAAVRFVQGDVTRLDELDIGTDFTLLMDGGCYHMIPPNRRDAYAQSVTRVAAPGARLIMVGLSSMVGTGMHREELLARMPGWRLLRLARVPGEQMCQYVSGPAPLRALLKRGLFRPLRYELERDQNT
ncbi:class I SAM-dependent methyltransferase [Mycobacterium hubeiense]|uniref:class I SAM-dependent methyltransferase n=1 Tax=Mycobacterium hubeiense TaxID=1867256 RepID=UPI000C7F20F3|nr:class I SAM-dependent methyltransferase [Mycobacterium sp. QGD 101]